MTVNLDQMIEELAAGFVPDGSRSLVVTLETLPEFLDAFIKALDELSAWAGGMGFEAVSNDILDIISACTAARLAAEDAAVNPQVQFLKDE